MKTRDKKGGFLFRRRYSLLFFFYSVIYQYVVVNRLEPFHVSIVGFSYHLVDYKSMGFRSQLLPGSVFYGIFGEHATETAATVYETVLLLLFFAGTALLLERFFLKAEQQNRGAALVLLLLYLSGPFTFAVFTDELGILDVYWLYFSLLFFLFLEKRGLRLLIPVLYALCLLVHFSSILGYLILFSVLLLYRVSLETEKKTKGVYLSVFACSLAVTAGLFVYFLLFQAKDLPLTQEAFHQLLQDRGGKYTLYYDYSFYNNFAGKEVVPSEVFSVASPVLRTLQMIAAKCRFTFYSYGQEPVSSVVRLVLAVLLLTPALCFLYKRLFGLFKSAAGSRLKRFSVFLMTVQFPFTAVLGCLFSPDIIRWTTHAFLVAFTMFLYVLVHEKALRAETFGAIKTLFSAPAARLWLLAYVSVYAWAYC